MGLQVNSYRQAPRAADWPAAAVSGFAAGAILMVLELFWTTAVINTSPWATSRMIAAAVMGAETMQEAGFSLSVVTVALLTHYTLGVLFGMALVAVSAPLRLDVAPRTALPAGAVFGAALYVISFYGMVHWLPWLAGIRGTPAIAAHLIFGMSTAVLYLKLARRGGTMYALQGTR